MKEFQLNSHIDQVGGFWPPDDEKAVTNGTLSSHGGRLYLSVSPKFQRLTNDELYEALMSNGSGTIWPRIDVLQGHTGEGRCTLVDLIQSTSKSVLNQPNSVKITAPVWRVGAAVMGLHIASDEAEVLDGAAYYISKIKNMLPSPGQLQMTEEGSHIQPHSRLSTISLLGAWPWMLTLSVKFSQESTVDFSLFHEYALFQLHLGLLLGFQ